jgi:hypothetical protein
MAAKLPAEQSEKFAQLAGWTASVQLDRMIDTLIEIKHQIFTKQVSSEEFSNLSDKLLDIREITRSIQEMIHKTND